MMKGLEWVLQEFTESEDASFLKNTLQQQLCEVTEAQAASLVLYCYQQYGADVLFNS